MVERGEPILLDPEGNVHLARPLRFRFGFHTLILSGIKSFEINVLRVQGIALQETS